MRLSPIYEQRLAEAREQGLQEGIRRLAEAREQGLQEGIRRLAEAREQGLQQGLQTERRTIRD